MRKTSFSLSAVVAAFCLMTDGIVFGAQPDAPNAVPGAIEGKVDVTLSGSASYSIPIRIPPGTAGTEPKIALVYDSQSSPSPLGAGWSISGLSKITRGPKTLRTDGLIQGVHFDASDALYLDGQRLIPTSPGCTAAGSAVTFVKETDDQTIVSGTCLGPEGIGNFVVRTKAGLTMFYGTTTDAQIKLSDQKILLWACSKIQDSSGNYIAFAYIQNPTGDYNIGNIAYTGNGNAGQLPFATIAFNYQTLGAPSSAFMGGYEIRRDSQLTSIVTAVSGVQASRYDLSFTPVNSLNRFLLQSITESGAVAANISDPVQPAPVYRNTNFTYSSADRGTQCDAVNPHCAWLQQPASGYGGITGLTFITPDNIAAGYRVSRIAGKDEGIRPQILYGADLHGVQDRDGFENFNGKKFEQWKSLAPPTPFNIDGADTGAIILDLDGDGHPYLFAPNPGGQYARAWHFTDVWNPAPATYLVPVGLDGKLPELVMAKVTQRVGPAADLLWSDGSGKSGTLVNQGPLMGLKDVGAPLPASLGSAIAIDVDCDGVKELAYFGGANSPTYSMAYRFDAGWQHAKNDAGGFVYDLPAVLVALKVSVAAFREITPEPNSASRCPLLLVAQDTLYSGAFMANAQKGWQADDAHNPKSLSPPILFADQNGKTTGVKIADNMAVHQKEIVASSADAGHSVTYAYLVTSTGFDALSPPLRPSEIGTQPLSYLGDLDGDGWPDLIYFANVRNQANEIVLYNPDNQTWIADFDFRPPVAFARQGQSDLGVRLVNLHGPDGRTDIIYRQDKSGAPISSPGAYTNTGFGWSPANLLAPKRPLVADYNLSNAVQFVDVDSDGFTDMLYSLRQKDGTVDAVFYRNVADPSGRAWDNGNQLPGYKPPIPFGDAIIGDLGARFADLNGDGRPDIIYSRMEKDGSITHGWCKNDGSTWLCQSQDGYTPPGDLVFVVMPGGNNNSSTSAQTDMQLFDVDGDGLPDLVFNYTDAKTKTVRQGVCLNNGQGWPSDIKGCGVITVPIALDHIENNRYLSIQYIDINGDGLVDIVKTCGAPPNTAAANQCVSDGGTQTFLGTGARSGAAWQLAPGWNIPAQVVALTPSDPGYRLIDVNGDGLPDILFADGKTSLTYFNTGSGWTQPQPAGFSPPTPLSSSDGSDTGARIIDLNGDGMPDLVLSYVAAGGQQTTGVWVNQNRRADVLTKIVDGLGVQTTICYQTLGERANPDACNQPQSYDQPAKLTPVYDGCPTNDQTFPILCATPSSYVVRRVTVQDGGPDRELSYNYAYEGLRFDLDSRQSLGFASRIANDEGSKQTTTMIELNQFDSTNASKDIWNLGLIATTEVTANGRKISLVAPTWQRVVRIITPNPATPTTQYRSWTVRQAATHAETYDLDGTPFGTEDDVFTYDDYGNVTSSTNTRSDGTSVSTANTYYDPDTTNWILGRLRSSTVVKVGDRAGAKRQTETRKATFAYSSTTGLLSQEVSNAGQQKQVTADYTRDKFGNITKTVLSAASEPSRTLTQTYGDRWGRFATSEIDAAGHLTQRTYSDTLGKVLSITDPNKLVTTFAYDGFGRLNYRKDPTTVTTRITFQWLGADSAGCPAAGESRSSATYTTVSRAGSLPPVTTSFDCRARPVDIATSGFSGNAANQKNIIQHTDYDIYGRVVSMTRPYFAGDPNPPVIGRTYDALDRVTKLVQPKSGAITLTQYKGHETTVVDALLHKTVIETNARNLPIHAVDPEGNAVTYSYDAGDRLTEITATFKDDHGKSHEAMTTHQYDDVGHLTVTTDPDLGKWEYQYNAFGNLVWQQDAKRQVTRITYDSLNRPLTRTAPGRSDNWEYDTAPGKGIGAVKSVTSTWKSILDFSKTDSYSEEYTYDNFARLSATAVRISNGQPYVSSESYDEYGRVVQTRAPDAFVIRNIYDSSGYLAKVTDAADGTVYWQALAVDAIGRVTNEKFANNVQTTRSYDPQSNFLTGIDTTEPNGSHIQRSTLTYDLAGNLAARQSLDSGQQHTTKYVYDDLQRLISVQEQGQKPKPIKYDATGGFTAKPLPGGAPVTGTFDYGNYSFPFHAVKSIKTSRGSTETFKYDPNGNCLNKATDAANGQQPSSIEFKYTADNRIQEINAPMGNWAFDYGADGHLFREYQWTNNSVGSPIYVQIVSVGLYQQVEDRLLIGTPWTSNRHFLTNAEGVFAVVDTPQLQSGRPMPGPFTTKTVHYLHKDHLGSVEQITDDRGSRTTIFDYDAWGYRSSKLTAADSPKYWTRGFSGHEETPDALFVHMNGRIYDPSTGNFTNPDLVTQSLTDSRTFNRYTYVLDNPLKYTDPTGYFHISISHIVSSVGHAISGVGHAISSAVQDIAHAAGSVVRWVVQNWKEVVVIAAAIGVTVLTGGTASPILVGLLVGATTSGLSSALYGGSLSQVLLATVKGAVFGAISGGIGEALSAGSFAAILAKGGLGGAESLVQGGNILQGFGIGALSDVVPDVNSIGGFDGAAVLRIGAQAALSGTIAVIEGGKFGNGAMWGAFSQLQTDSNSYNYQSVFDSDTAQEVGAAVSLVRNAATLVEEVKTLPLMAEGIVAGALVSTVSKLTGFNGSFQYKFNVEFASDQMSNDAFTMGAVLLGSSSVPKWSDAREYGVQGVGTAVFGNYSFQLAPTGNIGGSLGFRIQGAVPQQ
jgi:RHS repeat-associated protein